MTDQQTTHRSPRELIKHDLREWARDVVNLAPTGISPLEAVRQLALRQQSGAGRGRIQATETRSRRKPPDTPVRRLPYNSQRMDEALQKVARIDDKVARVLKTYACLSSVRGVAQHCNLAQPTAQRRLDDGIAMLLVIMEYG